MSNTIESLIQESKFKPRNPWITFFLSFFVPKQHIFLISENRNHTVDSRHIGPVSHENICGKVVSTLWNKGPKFKNLTH